MSASGERRGAVHLNRNQLKYLVVIAMVVDHTAWAYVPTASPLGQVMHFIGRLTGPTMAFFLAEGYLHTRSTERYALRLGIFALLSWIPFSLFAYGHWPTKSFGVIYTLFLGLLAIWIWDRTNLPVQIKAAAVAVLCLMSHYGDWPVFDVLCPLLLVICRNEPRKKWLAFELICVVACVHYFMVTRPPERGLYHMGILLVPPLLRYGYNGEPGSRRPFHKWFFYVFYPAHLLALAAALRLWR